MDHVILVDQDDNAIGTMEKLEAHQKGVLHRAFSIILFNSKGEILLQKRAATKYHSGGLWTNTCCSHPLPDEKLHDTVKRKLIHEMGIEADTTFSHKFIYKSDLGELTEHELDYVFVGHSDEVPNINPDEVEEWRYIEVNSLRRDVAINPDRYTSWFKIILEQKEFNQLLLS